MLQTLIGKPDPLGLTIQGDTANFAVFSSTSKQMILGLFSGKKCEEIPMKKSGDIWHIAVKNVPTNTTYAFKNNDHWLADPYAKIPADLIHTYVQLPPPFDWQGTEAPHIARQDLIIYEMHVRGMTRDPSSQVAYPGTFLGLIEKIPYLKSLGINAVELMPIFEFDPSYKMKPPLSNYWGYNTTHYFALQKRLSVKDPVDEFKQLIRELHRNQIAVILDVVYNHTGEGKEPDYFIHFRGLDDGVYYLHTKEGKYVDDSGCGNTVNCNHPVVQKLILDSLHYWAEEMRVDGFRFDLASILTRGPNGNPMAHPPLIEAISTDPHLSKKILIAEAWDAAGLYQLGAFPKWGPWAEWNGRYRDRVRKFIKGTDQKAGTFANAISGSAPLYSSPLHSINFITAHDGFCLNDLVMYQDKHNLANGENNLDGSNQNDNWNCGAEGPTADPLIRALRERQMRNFLLALFVSQGIPMLLMGDEYGHTRHGNNNPYVQDNELNWFLWDKQNPQMVAYVAELIALRKKHPELRRTSPLTDLDVEWHTDWNSRLVAYFLKPSLYIVFNAEYFPVKHPLPKGKWRLLLHTNNGWKMEKSTDLITTLDLPPYSAALCSCVF